MRNKFNYVLIIAFSILLIGCKFIKPTPLPKNQLNNKQLEEKYEGVDEKEPNEKSNEELSKNSDEKATPKPRKIVYLTFDDGPSSKVTSNVLDVLKENKVKATFFLIGNQIKGKEEIVKRIYNEGNSIGLHSYTHDYKKIYSNEDYFIKEMIDCRDEIEKVVGAAPNIIRFPGGTSKRLSSNFLKKLHDRNLKVYDWNLENSDGLKPKTSPDELYLKAINGSEQKNNVILLMHCTDNHQNTCKALPKIIKYYKSKGYEFRTVTEETKELYAPIKK